jgi:sulfonate transport system permease protein
MESGRQLFRIDVVMVGVILIGLIGFTLDRGFATLQRRFVRWQ